MQPLTTAPSEKKESSTNCNILVYIRVRPALKCEFEKEIAVKASEEVAQFHPPIFIIPNRRRKTPSQSTPEPMSYTLGLTAHSAQALPSTSCSKLSRILFLLC